MDGKRNRISPVRVHNDVLSHKKCNIVTVAAGFYELGAHTLHAIQCIYLYLAGCCWSVEGFRGWNFAGTTYDPGCA